MAERDDEQVSVASKGGEQFVGKRKARASKMKTAEQVRAADAQRMRNKLIAAGIPDHQVYGEKVYDFEANVRNIRKPVQDIVDKWFKDGGPGFDEPQQRVIGHCRELWLATGNSGALVANLDWIGGGGGGRERGWQQAEALAQLAAYRHEFLSYWDVFEDIVRWNTPATVAGEHLAKDNGRRIEKCKLVVGMICSVIAQARGY